MGLVKIAAIQMALREGDVEGNSSRAGELLDRAGQAGAALAVLPEMWWAGFSYRQLPSLAEGTPESLRATGDIARRYGMAVIGGWPEREGDSVFNTAFVLGPDGSVRGSYRKIHLFRPMKEDMFLSPGKDLTAIQLELGKVGVALCYDLRFPEQIRRLALSGAQVIALPSQWPEERLEHFWTLLRARAIENQLFVVGANRTGRGGKVKFGGYSAVIDPRGESLAECGMEEGMALAEVDIEEVAKTREEICYLDDRTPADEFKP